MTLGKRIESLIHSFVARYGTKPDVIVRSPARINIIGEHTDYNLGYVMPASIDRSFLIALAKNSSNQCSIEALDKGEKTFVDLDVIKLASPAWSNFIRGIIGECQKSGFHIEGFNASFSSTIPIGAGLSSSTALDCGFLKGISLLFDSNLSDDQIIRMSHDSSRYFIGVQSGLLDQYGVVKGKSGHCLVLDCRSLEYNYIKMPTNQYKWVIVNSGVQHEHSAGQYNDRPTECSELLKEIEKIKPSVNSLRDIDMLDLLRIKNDIPGLLFNRGRFILEENERVLQAVEAIKMNNMELLGQLLFESHAGLRDLYEVSCTELDVLVNVAKESGLCLGSRMVGAGFGGCTINLVEEKDVEEFVDHVNFAYYNSTGQKSEVIVASITNGAEQVFKQ